MGIFSRMVQTIIGSVFHSTTFWGSLYVSVINRDVFLFILVITGYLFHIKEITEMLNRAVYRVKRSASPLIRTYRSH
jgi:uncharacterized iron-regulated membrane protein